ncbi:Methyltransferase type 11 [Catenulispora acidiphila DSM 44928]|uniref:Methyltransferase type 11 n=1 Tax=Catenulispora acidiphila (strain DSM 44928 / JCM 14897 / NBRC 102108 / NRRL B-24433 / ID139908) TaxID=479433 RepID=C7QE25_CATAD|nr:class I SAM-dependent methyltransferase [Catenulispora acidiphila]ACU76613.1 Methyltransferase type 11 [Catenulispora acidiphila DSM 44928]
MSQAPAHTPDTAAHQPDPPRERYGDRLFRPERLDTEIPRLSARAAMYDDHTFGCLKALGVSPGWRCLDVGTGPGHVARWLAAAVGPQGTVTALDRSTRMLDTYAHPPNLDALEADALTAEPGRYDLVHCRLTLMHTPQRAALLARMASWVRPGGWLIVGDDVDFATHSSPHQALRQTFAAMRRMLNTTIGTDFHFARDYPGHLRELGLTPIGEQATTPTLRAGTAPNEFWLRTWDQLWPRMELDEAVYREARRLLQDPEVVDLSLTHITAWGRRPE